MSTPNISLTKNTQGGMFKVFVNDTEFSSHVEEKEAVENAVNQKFKNPDATVVYTINSEIRVEVSGGGEVQPDPLSDIAVSNLLLPSQITEGDVLSIEFAIANIGDADAPSFDYTVSVDDEVQVTGSLSGLPAGGSTTLSHTIENIGAGEHVIEVHADVNNVVAEPSTSNNIVSSVFTAAYADDPVDPQPTGDITTYAYIATWDFNVGGHGNWGSLSRSDVNWDAFDVGILFASSVSSEGVPRLPEAWENVSPDRINAFVEDANAAGKKAVMSFGGAGNSSGLFAAIENNPTTLANNLAAYIDEWGFDGIDIDAEPTSQISGTGLNTFLTRFRELKPNAIVVMAINGGLEEIAPSIDMIDHVNYMTYDLSGAWQGWYSWHNAAIYNPSGGTEVVNIPSSNTEYPNIDSIMNRMTDAGIPIEKCGFGISVDGYDWQGVDAPEQDAADATRTYNPQDITRLVDEYGITEADWIMDENAKVSYYSGDNVFVSVDNAETVHNKFDYARQKGTGGIILWKYTEYQPVVDALVSEITG